MHIPLIGKKSYIISGLLGIGAFAVDQHWISETFMDMVKPYLFAGGLATLRMAIKGLVR